MNSVRIHAAFLLAILTLVHPSATHGQSPDLKVLQVQYDNLLSERVTEAYNAGLAKLDASYLAGVERGLADAKAAGDLPGALSLQEEINRITSKGALPVNDEQTAPPLKKLRDIYRTELAKLETQRSAGQSALLPPYLARLKQLEADLTKADRLAEARAVMEYREAIAVGVPVKALVTSSTTVPSASGTRPTGRVSPGLSMQRYEKEPSQADNNKYTGYVFYKEFKKPLGAPHTIKTLFKWSKPLDENAVATGFIRIDKPGTYLFRSDSDYDRNELLLNGNIVCGFRNVAKFREAEKQGTPVELQAGLIPIVSVAYATTTKEVRVEWKPPGQADFSEIPHALLFH